MKKTLNASIKFNFSDLWFLNRGNDLEFGRILTRLSPPSKSQLGSGETLRILIVGGGGG